MVRKTKIEFLRGMECPGGEFTTVLVNGEVQGRLYDLQENTLGMVLKRIIEERICGEHFTCNSQEAMRQLNRL